jgi:hypothetical protein
MVARLVSRVDYPSLIEPQALLLDLVAQLLGAESQKHEQSSNGRELLHFLMSLTGGTGAMRIRTPSLIAL